MWDILGQKDYKKMRVQGLSGAHGVIMVCDLSRPDTIKSAEEFWLPEIIETCIHVPVVLVGNKNDIAQPGAAEALTAMSKKAEMPFAVCSAKTGENIEACFKRVGELMLAGELVEKKPGVEMSAESLAAAVDDVVSDFCEQYGDTSKAMELIEREFTKAKVNVNAPTKESLLMAIEYLSDVERDVHGRDVSEVNKLRRWKMIDEAR